MNTAIIVHSYTVLSAVVGMCRGLVKLIMAAVTVLWCTRSCTSLMAVLVPHADEHKVLVAYPCGLIYVAFSLLVVF
jgi:hypothetical protein